MHEPGSYAHALVNWINPRGHGSAGEVPPPSPPNCIAALLFSDNADPMKL